MNTGWVTGASETSLLSFRSNGRSHWVRAVRSIVAHLATVVALDVGKVALEAGAEDAATATTAAASTAAGETTSEVDRGLELSKLILDRRRLRLGLVGLDLERASKIT